MRVFVNEISMEFCWTIQLNKERLCCTYPEFRKILLWRYISDKLSVYTVKSPKKNRFTNSKQVFQVTFLVENARYYDETKFKAQRNSIPIVWYTSNLKVSTLVTLNWEKIRSTFWCVLSRRDSARIVMIKCKSWNWKGTLR